MRILENALMSSTAILFFGCSPSSAGGGTPEDAGTGPGVQIPASGPIAKELGPMAVATTICAKVMQCACDWSMSAPCTQDSVCDEATCTASYTMAYQGADRAATQAGEVYDPQGARACVDAVTAADCHDVDYHNLCTVLWNGTQAIGQPCGLTQACKTSPAARAVCGPDGTCVVDSPGPSTTGQPTGAACDGTCLGALCVITLGGSTGSGGRCQHAQGLACVGGTCQPLAPEGHSCAELGCADPLTCGAGVCAARLANGSPCSPGIENPCAVGSGCVAGVCVTLKANGQACASADECVENRCAGGQCVREFAQPLCGG
jgi:hypothetical protein